MSAGRCRSCNAAIWWVVTPQGANMPLDWHPAPYLVAPDGGGPLRIVVPVETSPGGTPRGKTISAFARADLPLPPIVDRSTLAEVKGWTPHWATCPSRQQHKAKKERIDARRKARAETKAPTEAADRGPADPAAAAGLQGREDLGGDVRGPEQAPQAADHAVRDRGGDPDRAS